jgi:hypothetical protein
MGLQMTVLEAKQRVVSMARANLTNRLAASAEQLLVKVRGVNYWLTNESLYLHQVPWIQMCLSTTFVTPILEVVPRKYVAASDQQYDANEAAAAFELISACIGSPVFASQSSDEIRSFRRAMAYLRKEQALSDTNATTELPSSSSSSSSSSSLSSSSNSNNLVECIGFEPVIANVPFMLHFACTIASELVNELDIHPLVPTIDIVVRVDCMRMSLARIVSVINCL